MRVRSPVRFGPGRLFLVLLLVLSALGGCAVLDEQQRKWIFQPGTRSWVGAGATDDLQDVWIDFRSAETREDVRLHGLWLPQADARAPLLLYRGFGQSTDALPSETLVAEDAQAAWAWLARQRPGAPRFVFGHSLGAAIAVALAADVGDEAGLIVEGSFPSILDVWGTWKWGWVPVGPFLTQRFDAASRIGQIGSPVLVVHGSDDDLIPPTLGRRLYERAASPKRFELVEGGSHHNTNSLGQAQYRQALRELFGLAAPNS
jgi:alpha-beta hydrolase superfamily lysophospholipase